jgi:hypothetical protein
MDFAPVKTVIQKSVCNNCWRHSLSAVVVHVDENFSPSMERTRERERERAFEKKAMRKRETSYIATKNMSQWANSRFERCEFLRRW